MPSKDEEAKNARITVGEIRFHLEQFNDDCEVSFGSEEGELFFCQTKSRGRDQDNVTNSISFELGTAELILGKK